MPYRPSYFLYTQISPQPRDSTRGLLPARVVRFSALALGLGHSTLLDHKPWYPLAIEVEIFTRILLTLDSPVKGRDHT